MEGEGSIAEPFSQALAREGFEPVVVSTLAAARDFLQDLETDLVLGGRRREIRMDAWGLNSCSPG